MAENNEIKNKQKKNYTYQYLPLQVKDILDFIKGMSNGTKQVDIIKEALSFYGEQQAEQKMPAFKLMKIYLAESRKENELLRSELLSLKNQVETMKSTQAELIKAVNRWMDKI